MKIKYLILLIFLSCNTSTVKEKKEPSIKGTSINVIEDGSYTVFTRYDTFATFVSQTKDGVLLDSTWMLAKPEISDDSLKKRYYQMVQGSKAQ